MKVIYIEPFAGVSGDMFLGALLDLGLDPDRLRSQLSLLPLSGYELAVCKHTRSGIEATKVDVIKKEAADHPDAGRHRHRHRTLHDIRHIIAASGLSEWVRKHATAAFEKLAAAEGKIHNQVPEKVHFHEVGALDSIIDIVGSMIAVEAFMPADILCAPVNVGRGTLECRHGIYPAPGPAVLELLRGVPIYSNSLAGELTTPTGAALLSVLVDRFDHRPLMKAEGIGYGAGTRDIPGAANVLRLSIGTTASEEHFSGAGAQVAVIEANIDDMNPQLFGYFFDRALAGGALDVYVTPVQMKKNRPGAKLTVLCSATQLDQMIRLVFDETTTVGVRYRMDSRRTLDRRMESVTTEYGAVRIKVASIDGRDANFVPEFEDCRRLAEEKGVPLKEVMAAATRRFLEGK